MAGWQNREAIWVTMAWGLGVRVMHACLIYLCKIHSLQCFFFFFFSGHVLGLEWMQLRDLKVCVCVRILSATQHSSCCLHTG